MASDLNEDALGTWLTAHIAGFAAPFSVTKFRGGQSNPTYLIDAASEKYVLRRKPFGDLLPSAHAVDREFKLISALHPAGFPTANPLALCDDTSIIGSMFYVMGYLDGRTLWDGALPGMTRDQRTGIYHSLIDTLAALHTIDPVTVGLGDYGKPGNYFGRQVERWTKQYRASQTDDLPAVEHLIDYLPKTVPVQTRIAIVHGDYRIDNLIFAADGPKVLGVLDWELSTLGDPLADFTYLLMNWMQPAESRAGIGGLDLNALGIPPVEEAVARYCQATNRDGLPELNWYFAYNLFRAVGILQGVKKRALGGNASSTEAMAMAARIPSLADHAWHLIQQG